MTITSKAGTAAYVNNYDRIFGKKGASDEVVKALDAAGFSSKQVEPEFRKIVEQCIEEESISVTPTIRQANELRGLTLDEVDKLIHDWASNVNLTTTGNGVRVQMVEFLFTRARIMIGKAIELAKTKASQPTCTEMSVEEAKAMIASGAVICCEEFDREPCPVRPDLRCKSCPHEIAKKEDLIGQLMTALHYGGPRAGLLEHARKVMVQAENSGWYP